ncbi:MAG TPA: transglycosylase domain-containing protein, partial [Nevskiaceae bacterium]|nr:transglycosylase domain-containing protein [Nevskiaceae bacterium]
LLQKGLIAVEDKGFYHHWGISIRGIFRAAFHNLMAGHAVEGASTLTQQLVKNFFLTPDRSFKRKLTEVCMALLLELHYSKDEILEAYMNEIQLGQDGGRSVNGFGLGAQFYFNKPVSELRSHEIALLVALAKGTSYYNPHRNPQRALERRNLVLGIFKEEGLISEAEYDSAIARPLGLAGSKSQGADRYPAFVDLVKRQLRTQYKDEDLTHEGLRIFTTLEPRAQEVLEQRITQGLPVVEKSRKLAEGTLQGAGVITSVEGGEVRALVAGRDVRYAGYNRALDSRRSIGSLAKPFVYLTALERPSEYNLYSILPDDPIELKLPNRTTWSPNNYDHKLHGPQPLYMALAQSYNLPTVALGLKLGPDAVLDTMHKAGYTGDAQALPSIFLGAVDAAPIEVAQMYATLAASGYQSPLSAIREVQTKEGEPLTRFPIEVKATLPEAPVYLLTWAMEHVLTLGTARSAYNVISPDIVLAGKTGTTDDLRDSWFAGFSGDRVAVVWVGRDDYKPMGLTGAQGALPIWTQVMHDLRTKSLDVTPPAEVDEQLTDVDTGLRADERCTGAITVPYLHGFVPEQAAPCAGGATTPLEWLKNIFK